MISKARGSPSGGPLLPKSTKSGGGPNEWISSSTRIIIVLFALSAWVIMTISMNVDLNKLVELKNLKAVMSGGDDDVPFKKYYVEISDSSENVLPPGTDNYSNVLDKSKKYDVCAIGAGLSGTVFAERSANLLEQNVLVIDSRPHIGGNCYDFHDQKTGILRNQYGSHLFHTNIKRVWDYVTGNPNAPKWRSWYHAKFGRVDGMYVPIPVNTQTVNRLLDLNIQTKEEMEEWLESVQIPCPENGCENAEQMAKSRVGEVLYKKIFEGYTIKQWGKSPKELKASVTARIPVFSTFDPRYFADKYQALPGDGYTAWFKAQLDHPLIDVVLNTDFFDHREHLESACGKIIYTGPIDRYFEEEGMEKLEYRSITFTEERHYNHPGYMLPTPVLNLPGMETIYTRAVEYKQYLHRPSNHTLVVKETTSHDGEPYYPVPTTRNQELYAKYQKLSEKLEKKGKILFVGRLANYKYFNMDQAIDNALTLFYKSAFGKLRKETKAFAKAFMKNEFPKYKAVIDKQMAEQYPPADNSTIALPNCNTPLAPLEFGMELRAIVPWAYKKQEECARGVVHTRSVSGSRYMYFFSNDHIIDKTEKRKFLHLDTIEGNPFGGTVHKAEAPKKHWKPPPYAEFFSKPEFFKSVLRGKPLVVILNKYTAEWGREPANFFDTDTLREVLTYLTPNYTVLYKRTTPKSLFDHQDKSKVTFEDLDEKDMIRYEFPDVLMMEDFSDELTDPDDFNLLQFGLMSQSSKFLTVQGGTAVIGSYFGGTNIILIKEGREIESRDYEYFPKFSNATVVEAHKEKEFLSEMRRYM